MIISASRRTDIPAFYAEWFINRIRAGYCTVPNPYNRSQVSYVSLKPEDVDVIVFWTRNPAPLLPYLDELDERGYRYYFQYTLLNNPRSIDPKTPPLETAIATFQKLSGKVGAARVIWRYDPIVFTRQNGLRFHMDTYQKIAASLKGYTHRSVVSILDFYRKAEKRLQGLKEQGIEILDYGDGTGERFGELMTAITRIASENGMEIVSCAEQLDLACFGIKSGKCVDDDLIRRVFGIEVDHTKDPYQRPACGCVTSKDIGMYDTCLFGCQYCYATSSFERARINHENHDPQSPSLIGWYEATPTPQNIQLELPKEMDDEAA